MPYITESAGEISSMRSTRLGTFLGSVTMTVMACVSVAHDDDRDDRQVTATLRDKVQNIVVIYAENRSFDNIFGDFPGARGLDEVVKPNGTPRHSFLPQRDRDGTILPTLPQTWGGVTAAGVTPVVTQAASGGLPNA